MKCPQCGAELAPGARYCGECWAVVSPQPSETTPPATDSGPARDSTPTRAGHLVVEIGPDEGKVFPLRGTMRIGRSEDSEITLADAQASRHHAAISPEPGGFTIQDLNSSNGTFVNGKRVDEPRILKDGDRLRVANTVLVFRWESASTVPSATPRVTPPAVDYEMLPTTEVAWQTPPAGIQEAPAPQAAEPRKGLYAGRIMLGAGLVIVFLAVAAVALYFLLGNPNGDKSSSNAGEKPPAAITQVVTSAPTQVVTKVVTSEPVATATATPTIAPTIAPTVTPTMAPTVAATATPSGPTFGPITFARDKTDANEPIDPTSTFPADTLRVYALFDYEGMSADLEWGRTWYRDGEEYVSKTENWSGKESGTWSLWLFRTSGDPLVPATYELRIYIQGKQVQSATFVVTE